MPSQFAFWVTFIIAVFGLDTASHPGYSDCVRPTNVVLKKKSAGASHWLHISEGTEQI